MIITIPRTVLQFSKVRNKLSGKQFNKASLKDQRNKKKFIIQWEVENKRGEPESQRRECQTNKLTIFYLANHLKCACLWDIHQSERNCRVCISCYCICCQELGAMPFCLAT